jgi:CheY-like chemotaxis protein
VTVRQEGVCLLVVEDDRRVLAATCDVLREIGHDPIACLSGDEAEAALVAHDDIALVVSDVLMPGLTGPQLLAKLREQRPDLKALFVTGYAGEAGEAGDFGDDPVVRKPFTIAILSAAIAAALDRPVAQLETRAAA